MHRLCLRIGNGIFQNPQQQSTRWIEPISINIFFQTGKDSQGLPIALKSPVVLHAVIQSSFTSMPKRRMPQIVSQANGAS